MKMAYKKLGDVCEILDSKRIPITASERKSGQYPYYGANGVQDYVSDFIFDDELVLLAEDGGNFGSKDRPIAYRVSGKCWVNNHAHVLKPLPDIDVDYLCYALMFYDTTGLINGATRQKLTQSAMRQMQIPIRSLDEQKAIVQKISTATGLITLRKTQLQKLDQLASSRFIEMFGDSTYQERNISEVCKIVTDGTHQSPKFTDSGIPFLFVSNIVDNAITYETSKFISVQTYNELTKRTPIEIGDILLTIVGSYGNPAVVKSDKPFCFQRHLAYMKLKTDIIHPEYLHAAFLSANVKEQIERKVKGIAQKTLNLSELKSIYLPLPPLELQNEFAAFVEQLDKSKLADQIYEVAA